jgi:hypothetical protein
MYNPMDIGTTRGVATSLYSYIGKNPKELVYKIGTAQGNCKLGRFADFVITFAFEHENPEIDTTLKLVRDRIFEELEVDIVTAYRNQKRQIVRQSLHCYYVVEDDRAEENPRDIKITEVEGEREVVEGE